jgi:hypothetical protein
MTLCRVLLQQRLTVGRRRRGWGRSSERLGRVKEGVLTPLKLYRVLPSKDIGVLNQDWIPGARAEYVIEPDAGALRGPVVSAKL